MSDVGDLPVLTFGNCVLRTGVIEWPLELYVRFTFLRFFSKSKNTTLYSELLHTLSRTLTLLYAARPRDSRSPASAAGTRTHAGNRQLYSQNNCSTTNTKVKQTQDTEKNYIARDIKVKKKKLHKEKRRTE